MFEFFINGIASFFGVKSFLLANAQAKSKAISTIKFALALTKKHIDDTRVSEFGENNFTDVESKELAKAWIDASEAIRPFDESLARAFEAKCDYWMQPWRFHQEIIDGTRRFNYKFRLVEVEKELLRLEKSGF